MTSSARAEPLRIVFTGGELCRREPSARTMISQVVSRKVSAAASADDQSHPPRRERQQRQGNDNPAAMSTVTARRMAGAYQ